MARYTSLNEAMEAKDDLAEVELRYKLLAEVFEDQPKLRANLNPALERAKAEIVRLRAVAAAKPASDSRKGKVVAIDSDRFDPSRFKKSGGVGESDPGLATGVNAAFSFRVGEGHATTGL